MTIDKVQFRSTLGMFASGVAIVTTTHTDGSPVGLTINAFSSVSLDPPLVLICIANTASSFEALTRGGPFAVHVLREEQEDLSRRFANSSPSKWEGVRYRPGVLGNPMLTGCLASLECETSNMHPAGDHVVIIGLVQHCFQQEGRPLLYFRGRYQQLPNSHEGTRAAEHPKQVHMVG